MATFPDSTYGRIPGYGTGGDASLPEGPATQFLQQPGLPDPNQLLNTGYMQPPANGTGVSPVQSGSAQLENAAAPFPVQQTQEVINPSQTAPVYYPPNPGQEQYPPPSQPFQQSPPQTVYESPTQPAQTVLEQPMQAGYQPQPLYEPAAQPPYEQWTQPIYNQTGLNTYGQSVLPNYQQFVTSVEQGGNGDPAESNEPGEANQPDTEDPTADAIETNDDGDDDDDDDEGGFLSSIAELDDSGTLGAAIQGMKFLKAAIGITGTIATASMGTVAAYNAKKAADPQSNAGRTASLSAVADPADLKRANQTIVFVLWNFGKRIAEADLFSAKALGTALGNAQSQIQGELFSNDMRQLLGVAMSKTDDPFATEDILASIYLMGALAAELTVSLRFYKDKEGYPRIGPTMVQQLVTAAIGQDAFMENRIANILACEHISNLAGMLRPTDMGYTIFPAFPSFPPTRYSTNKSSETRGYKSNFEKLIKHFEKNGFPQPLPDRSVSRISDWRFLSGDTNARVVELEKADKHVGTLFGRVVHWLTCSADRMPDGLAVIAYFEQHIQFTKWLGSRTNLYILDPATDLDMSPKPHAKLDSKLRGVFESWVVIMALPADKRVVKEQRAVPKEQIVKISKMQNVAAEMAKLSLREPTPAPSMPGPQRASTYPAPQAFQNPVSQQGQGQPGHQQHLAQNASMYAYAGVQPGNASQTAPQQVYGAQQGANPQQMYGLAAQYGYNTQTYGQHSTYSQGTVPVNGQNVQNPIPTRMYSTPAPGQTPYSLPTYGYAQSQEPQTTASQSPNAPQAPMSAYSPPLQVPTPASVSSEPPSYEHAASKRQSVIRRKAPPRPAPKLELVIAECEFEPEHPEDELGFKEGDIIEVVDKKDAEDGWWRGRIKGGNGFVGLVPIDYIKPVEKS